MAEIYETPAIVKYTQAQKIVQHLAQFGFITPLAAIHRQPILTTKLSTRIGEMERKTGIHPERTRDAATRCVRYTYTPEQVAELRKFYRV